MQGNLPRKQLLYSGNVSENFFNAFNAVGKQQKLKQTSPNCPTTRIQMDSGGCVSIWSLTHSVTDGLAINILQLNIEPFIGTITTLKNENLNKCDYASKM